MTDDRPDDATLEDRIERLHAHLEDTETLPIDREANRWIGEAEAVVADLVGAPAEAETVRRRAGHVVDLLQEIEETGDERADEHVAAALEIARDAVDDRDVDSSG